MLTIDIHTHLLPETLPAWANRFGYGGFIELERTGPCTCRMVQDGKKFRDIESNNWDPAVRISECDAHGVHVQVLSTVPVLFHYWAKPQDTYDTARFLNDHLAGVVGQYPHRFVGLGTLPMQEPELAILELRRCMHELGLAGVQIGTNINQLNLDEQRFRPFFAEAESLGAALFVHPWDMMGQQDMTKYWLPWLVGMPAETSRALCSILMGGVLWEFPKLRLAFAHGGGSFPATLGRINHGYAVRPDLCATDSPQPPSAYLGSFWFDSLVHDPYMLRYLVQLAGEDKVALGTDYPYPLGEWLGEWQPGRLIRSIPEFSSDVQRKLLGMNALQWLNLPAERFLPVC